MDRWNKKKMVAHGYWELKYANGKVGYKYTYNNGMYLGYREAYDANGKMYIKQISI
tara:strand:+ start:582 stop:749 length:168 start_codon:yes stop_codon:yes gene_type:complete